MMPNNLQKNRRDSAEPHAAIILDLVVAKHANVVLVLTTSVSNAILWCMKCVLSNRRNPIVGRA
jgi:hypothetical protein